MLTWYAYPFIFPHTTIKGNLVWSDVVFPVFILVSILNCMPHSSHLYEVFLLFCTASHVWLLTVSKICHNFEKSVLSLLALLPSPLAVVSWSVICLSWTLAGFFGFCQELIQTKRIFFFWSFKLDRALTSCCAVSTSKFFVRNKSAEVTKIIVFIIIFYYTRFYPEQCLLFVTAYSLWQKISCCKLKKKNRKYFYYSQNLKIAHLSMNITEDVKFYFSAHKWNTTFRSGSFFIMLTTFYYSKYYIPVIPASLDQFFQVIAIDILVHILSWSVHVARHSFCCPPRFVIHTVAFIISKATVHTLKLESYWSVKAA